MSGTPFDQALQAARHDDPSVRQRAALWLGTHADETVAADLVHAHVRAADAVYRFDATAMGLGMDGVNRLFSNANPALRVARARGVGRAGPAWSSAAVTPTKDS